MVGWWQYTITLPASPRGFHLITQHVEDAVEMLPRVQVGQLHLFIQHTSASLTINENADPSVRRDLEMAFNHVAPERLPYTHTMEGSDDMPAHVKCSLLDSGLLIPVQAGSMALGTWQGIYLCEHRNHAGPRTVLATLQGMHI